MYATFIYNPLYNGLILLTNLLPFLDAGTLIVLFTLLVKLVLYPISKKAVRTQALMKELEPELRAIKNTYKDDKQKQAIETMNLYKKKEINLFSSILLLVIQIPIIFALYKIFYSNGLSDIHTDILYSFVQAPGVISMSFLGLLDITEKSVVLALFAAISQYFQIKLSVPASPKLAPGEKPSFQDDLARNMQTQMKYVFPVMIFFISQHLPAGLAIYWTTSNLFMIAQEIYIRRQLKK